MGKIVYADGVGVPHRGFEDEFLTHRKCSEWWYATGYLEDEEGGLFSFQFTLACIRMALVKIHLLLTSITDIATQKHYYAQQPAFRGKGIVATPDETSFQNLAGVRYAPNEVSSLGDMAMSIRAKEYGLKLTCGRRSRPSGIARTESCGWGFQTTPAGHLLFFAHQPERGRRPEPERPGT